MQAAEETEELPREHNDSVFAYWTILLCLSLFNEAYQLQQEFQHMAPRIFITYDTQQLSDWIRI